VTGTARVAVAAIACAASACLAAPAARPPTSVPSGSAAAGVSSTSPARPAEATDRVTPPGLTPDATPAHTPLESDLDAIFRAPILARAVVGARIASLDSGRVLYSLNPDTLVMPASNLKILTVAVAAERLGWDYRYETRLEAAGAIDADGTLHGDLVVTGTGDTSIGSQDAGPAALFFEWADDLRRAGIRRVDGRLIGDDNAFSDETLGAGWAWDYLAAGYAAPAGALNYNENVAVVHIAHGPTAGAPATVSLTPPGHGLTVVNRVVTTAAGAGAVIELSRAPGSANLIVTGSVPIDGPPLVRTAAVDNPTRYFVEALRLALASRGIVVADGAWDIDDVTSPVAASARQLIARRESAPLSSLAGYAMKVSQNFYGETFFRTLGRTSSTPASAEGGRAAVRDTLSAWGVPDDAYVMNDGSGLSRYDYASAAAIVQVLAHVWHDERLRGPFAAALPVAGHDGTLAARMKGGALDRRVQGKTGTISNARALSGYLTRANGEHVAFSIIVNNYTASNAQVDAVVERALAKVEQSHP
jgi:D-alanyl-D-alanine carboxypeptidase/D-alanyl-D-alanine-endopeptidase (penicillin-binding protein 4)